MKDRIGRRKSKFPQDICGQDTVPAVSVKFEAGVAYSGHPPVEAIAKTASSVRIAKVMCPTAQP